MIARPANDRAPVRFWTADEIAEKVFGRTRDWFYRNRRKLEAERGFPPAALPHLWDPRAIAAWQRALTAPPDEPRVVIEVADVLAERGGKLANPKPKGARG